MVYQLLLVALLNTGVFEYSQSGMQTHTECKASAVMIARAYADIGVKAIRYQCVPGEMI